MGRPFSINIIEDMGIGVSNVDLLRNTAEALLSEKSLVVCYMNGEDVLITASVKIGSEQAMPPGRVALMATVGVMPLIPTNRILISAGDEGERIQIPVSNGNAALKEARAIVFVIPLIDIQNYPTILSNI